MPSQRSSKREKHNDEEEDEEEEGRSPSADLQKKLCAHLYLKNPDYYMLSKCECMNHARILMRFYLRRVTGDVDCSPKNCVNKCVR